jgi:hypothetical protein
MKPLGDLETLGANHPVTRRHIPQQRRLQMPCHENSLLVYREIIINIIIIIIIISSLAKFVFYVTIYWTTEWIFFQDRQWQKSCALLTAQTTVFKNKLTLKTDSAALKRRPRNANILNVLSFASAWGSTVELNVFFPPKHTCLQSFCCLFIPWSRSVHLRQQLTSTKHL